MRKINSKGIIILIALSCYLLLSLIFLINNLGGIYFDVINPIFFGLVFIACYCFFKKEYVHKKNRFDILLTIIILMILFFVTYYLSGFIVGFQKTPYDTSLKGIITNIFNFGLIVLFQEYIRKSLVNRTGKNKKLLVFITFLFIMFDVSDTLVFYEFNNFESFFKFFVIYLNPAIAKHSLLTYLTYTSDILPTLIYRLLMEMFSFIVPFVPNFNWFLMGVINIVYPFIVFSFVYRILHRKDDIKRYKKTYKGIFFYLPITAIITMLIVLVSGSFKYQIIAVASNSMNPIFYRGDAVVIEKCQASDVKVNDIVVFESEGAMIIHRIIEKEKLKNDTFVFKTKGDNNKSPDPYMVTSNQIIGKYKFGVKLIGYPSVMFQDVIIKK